jgi:hypothetical protein
MSDALVESRRVSQNYVRRMTITDYHSNIMWGRAHRRGPATARHGTSLRRETFWPAPVWLIQ